jgi:eukaryotic-like serine/threonine-protein kinase
MGGTGAVLAAYDPRLDRPVAIKVPRRNRRTVRDDTARARLIREAQALAAVVHPNVVEVYDVGSDDDISDDEVLGVYIVMEKLEGMTLRAWMAQPRPWREVVEVFVAAGRGLVAAHDQRLLHRDFKPENVMVTTDGRVKVLDFGLARAVEGAASTPTFASSQHLDEHFDEPASSVGLTETGIVMGTPRYMAPEQHAGRKATPASDQYAFCSAMLEALRRRPVFEGRNLAELRAAKLAFRSRRGQPSDDFPPWLRELLERGLCVDPTDRWPSMVRLLDAIERGARSRRRAMTGIAGVFFCGLAALWWLAPTNERLCGDAKNPSDLWNEERTHRIRSAFVSADATLGPEAARELSEALETRAHAWATLQDESCAAYRSAKLDGRAFDRRMLCFRARRAEIDALVEQLAAADDRVVHGAAEIPSRLGSPEACVDDEALAARMETPSEPAAQQAVAEIEETLARAHALLAVRRTTSALDELETASRRAASIDHRPTMLRVAIKRGEAFVMAGLMKEAVELVEPVLFECESHGYDRLAFEAILPLLFALVELGRADDAIERFPRALALADRAQASPEKRARLKGTQAAVLAGAGRMQEARPLFEQAIEELSEIVGEHAPEVQALLNNYGSLLEKLGEVDAAIEIHGRLLGQRERERGENHPSLLAPLTNLGAAHLAAAQYDEAIAAFERAIALSLAHYGPDDVKSHHAFVGMGVVLKKMGRYEEAIEHYERALEIVEGALGPDHPNAAMLLANIGNARKRMGETEAALELHRRALDMRERSLGPDHKDLAMSHQDISSLMRELGRLRDARLHLEHARRINEKTFGPEHVELSTNELLLGLLEHEEGNIATASKHFERALELREHHHGSEHVMLADPLYQLGVLLHEQGQLERAAEHLGRAARLRELASVAPALIGAARFELAKTQWALGNHEDARKSTRRAIVAFADATPTDDRLEEATAWLAAHDEGSPPASRRHD